MGWRIAISLICSLPGLCRAWEEQQALDFILAYNPLLQAHHRVTAEYTPPKTPWAQVLEHASVYGRAGAGGTDYLSQPVTLQVGMQITIPLASTRERREQALKAVEEIQAIDEVRGKTLADIAQLRQSEADLQATQTRLGFYEKKSAWLQKRVKAGYEDTPALWDIGQKLTEERAATGRLRALLAATRYRVAHYAGMRWQALLAYLEGKADLP
jgi:hypothetical protein